MSAARGKSDKSALQEAPRAQAPTIIAPKLPPPLARVAQAPTNEKRTAAHKFDKAFPVLLLSDRGVANGVGRNISPEGMFIETRDVCPIGSELRVLFGADVVGTEIAAVADVRFQCYLNFAGGEGEQDGLRGMGVRFKRFEEGPRTGPGAPVAQ